MEAVEAEAKLLTSVCFASLSNIIVKAFRMNVWKCFSEGLSNSVQSESVKEGE